MTDNHEYRLRKRTRRKTGFPLATLLFYGPDETRASKAVLAVLSDKRTEEISALRRWFSDKGDIRGDPTVLAEIVDMLDEHDVHRVSTIDRIVGCPHEEGIDYPKGEVCPQCPYWKNRDRWTGEIIE